MATFLTDFSEYTSDVPPSDWTDRGYATWSTDVVAATISSSFGDKQLSLVANTADNHRLLSWDDIDADANRDDFDVIMRFEVSYGYGVGPYIYARASGDFTGSYDCYRAYYAGGDLKLYKVVAGTGSTLATVSLVSVGVDYSDIVGIPHWIRFRGQGSTLQVKMWSEEYPEPSWWFIEHTDSSITAAGWVGVGHYDSPYSIYVDYFGVGTDGDSPALPVATSGDQILEGMHVEAAVVPAIVDELRLEGMHVEAAVVPAIVDEFRLEGMHVEAAVVPATVDEFRLEGMHLEVAYSIPPSEMQVTMVASQVLGDAGSVSTPVVTYLGAQVLAGTAEVSTFSVTQVVAQVLGSETGGVTLARSRLLFINC